MREMYFSFQGVRPLRICTIFSARAINMVLMYMYFFSHDLLLWESFCKISKRQKSEVPQKSRVRAIKNKKSIFGHEYFYWSSCSNSRKRETGGRCPNILCKFCSFLFMWRSSICLDGKKHRTQITNKKL